MNLQFKLDEFGGDGGKVGMGFFAADETRLGRVFRGICFLHFVASHLQYSVWRLISTCIRFGNARWRRKEAGAGPGTAAFN